MLNYYIIGCNIMSNISMLTAIIDDLCKMLNSKGLQRVNPIFNDGPAKGLANGQPFIRFPYDLSDYINNDVKIKPEHHQPFLAWWVFGGLILRCHLMGDLEYPEKHELIRHKNCPDYIKYIVDTVRRRSCKSLIQIDDNLPEYLLINIETDFKLKDEREGQLHSIARAFLKNRYLHYSSRRTLEIQSTLDEIINNKMLSFKGAVQQILGLSGLGVQGDFSYCLACGKEIDKLNAREEPNFFCKNPSYSNLNECRNIFRYRQKSRLKGLDSPKKRKQYALKLYMELQELTRARALVAFEELKKNHPKLYEDGRKSRTY